MIKMDNTLKFVFIPIFILLIIGFSGLYFNLKYMDEIGIRYVDCYDNYNNKIHSLEKGCEEEYYIKLQTKTKLERHFIEALGTIYPLALFFGIFFLITIPIIDKKFRDY